MWLVDGAFSGSDELVIDPVCGMEVERFGAGPALMVDGEELRFCCTGCRDEYEARRAGGGLRLA